MPTIGDQVTVRALISMPGVDEGHVLAVQWGPHLATLVDQRRYELVQDPPRSSPGPAGSDGHEAPPTQVAVPGDQAHDGAPVDAPSVARRGRGR